VSQVELAKRYAKAILEIGHQKGKAKEYASQIQTVSKIIFSQADVVQFFTNTTIAQDLKKKSLDSLFQNGAFSEDVKAFLYLLIDRSRFYALADIVQAAQNILDNEDGVTRGKIKSASQISEQTKHDYEKKISASLGRKIFLEAAIDPKVLGGVRIEVGGWTFDDSLETHLGHLSDKLMKQSN
jgi:F-type H+-transporting ATPase subunit delta